MEGERKRGRVFFLIAMAVVSSVFSGSVDASWRRSRYGVICYSIFVPKNYSASLKYPVFMILHGAGERGTDYRNENNQDAQILTSDSNQAKYPCIVFAPQCRLDSQYVNTNWGSDQCSYSSEKISESATLRDAMKVLEDSICNKYSVDLNRIYVGGGSMGGFGTWDLLVRHSEKFAAAVAVSGGGDTAKAGNFATKVPVWVFHCAEDYVVKAIQSQCMVDAIKRHGGTPKFNLYTKSQLNKNGYVYYDTHMWILPFQLEPQLMPWVFGQTKAGTCIDATLHHHSYTTSCIKKAVLLDGRSMAFDMWHQGTISVFEPSGRLIARKKVEKAGRVSIDLPGVIAGMLYVQLSTEGRRNIQAVTTMDGNP